MRFKFDLVATEEMPTISTPNGRFYRTPTGEQYPSVTTVLGAQPEKKSILDKWRERIGRDAAEKISSQAARRGTEVHALIENYVLNEILPSKDLALSHKYIFAGMRSVIDKNLEIVRGVELPLYSHRLKLAGRTDMIGRWNGVNAVIDYKTSKRTKREEWCKDYFIQTTAYSIMFEEMTGIEVPNVVVLIGVDDEALPQVFVRPRNDYVHDLFRIINEFHENNH